jgi:hypothetical protein
MFAAPLFVFLVLWSCKGESNPQAPVSTEGGPPAAASGTSADNHLPVVRSARIYPPRPMIEMELRVEVQGEDMDGDPIMYRYKWLVNGVPAPGATASRFRTDGVRRGEQITVEVTPNDVKGDGAPFTTDPVTIDNTPPDIAEIQLEPVPLHRGDQLKVTVIAGDPDGDPVTLSYKWLRNDKEIPGAKGDLLDTKEFRKTDVLAVLVTPSDGKLSNAPRAGLPVTIENSPPRFTSTPPVEIKDGQYSYQVVVTDPDEDPITLELKQGPPGMTLDPATKQLVWKLTPENLGRHRVVLAAKDTENAVTQQEFELDAQPPTPAAPAQ